MPIQKMSAQLAAQIAAGEVVERPASVVKELLENSVDSGARNIRCEYECAGREKILVRDDGPGIEEQELPLALAAHATSKITAISDLDAITTLGFRGEALASIAAVSRLTLTSKARGAAGAFSVHVEGSGQVPVTRPAAHPDGTTVEVCELFFNTPARRRFMRSDRTESAHIREVFVRCAMAHPEIAFTLVADGRTVLSVEPSDGSEEGSLARIAALAGGYYNDAARLSGSSDVASVSGLLLPLPRPGTSMQEQIYFFLNGRPVADRQLLHALREAYTEVCGASSPIRAVIYLSCDPGEVDVNVHPRKDEVRFHQSRLVHDTVAEAVAGTLRRFLHLAEGEQESLDFVRDLPPPPDPMAPDPRLLEQFPSGTSVMLTPAMIEAARLRSLSETAGAAGGTGAPAAGGGSSGSHSRSGGYGYAGTGAFPQQNGAGTFSQQGGKPVSRAGAWRIVAEAGAGLLAEVRGRFFLLSPAVMRRNLPLLEYLVQICRGDVKAEELDLPFTVKADRTVVDEIKAGHSALERCGFRLTAGRGGITLEAVPDLFFSADFTTLCTRLLPVIARAADRLLTAEAFAELTETLRKLFPEKSDLSDDPVKLSEKIPETRLYAVAEALARINVSLTMPGIRELPLAQWAGSL